MSTNMLSKDNYEGGLIQKVQVAVNLSLFKVPEHHSVYSISSCSTEVPFTIYLQNFEQSVQLHKPVLLVEYI